MDSRRRSIAKALSWRAVATTCTGAIVWLLTGAWEAAVSVGSLDVVVKLAAYYGHERIWARVPYGLEPGAAAAASSDGDRSPETAAVGAPVGTAAGTGAGS